MKGRWRVMSGTLVCDYLPGSSLELKCGVSFQGFHYVAKIE